MKNKLTDRARRAIRKYGERACTKAYEMHLEGYGAAGVAAEGPVELRTTRQADAAISAGEEIAAIVSEMLS